MIIQSKKVWLADQFVPAALELEQVSKWELAEASPDTDNLILLAEIYGVSLDELLKGESNNSSKSEAEQIIS